MRVVTIRRRLVAVGRRNGVAKRHRRLARGKNGQLLRLLVVVQTRSVFRLFLVDPLKGLVCLRHLRSMSKVPKNVLLHQLSRLPLSLLDLHLLQFGGMNGVVGPWVVIVPTSD